MEMISSKSRLFGGTGLALLLAALAFFAPFLRASDDIPAPPQPRPILLQHATIHPVSGPDLPNADLLIVGGKIKAIGQNLPVPDKGDAVDLAGMHLYPGLIAANTSIGLQEIDSVRGTIDLAEPGDLNPNARAETALNPDSELIPVTRSNGILAALCVPQSNGGLISGTSALIQMDGWTSEDLVLKAPVGLHLFWPDMRINPDPRFPKSPADQKKDLRAKLQKIEDAFAAARSYAVAKKADRPDFLTDLRWEAMLPALDGKIPVFIHADELKQIEAAIDFSVRQKLKMVLVDGEDACLAMDLLKKNDIPVIVSSTFVLPERRQDSYEAAYANAAKLQAAGIRFCIAPSGADAEAPHLRNLPYQAGMAAAHGLPKDEALKSITLYPAQILGVADRLGSLEVGKDATLLVTTGDPLEVETEIKAAYISGRAIDLTNRQTRLRDKYREKYRQLHNQ